MQEKIGQIINDWHLKASRTIYWQENAAAEIAKLFERKVIWEGAEDIHHETVDLGNGIETELTYIGCLEFGLNIAGHKGKHGQRVRVIVEEIDESKA